MINSPNVITLDSVAFYLLDFPQGCRPGVTPSRKRAKCQHKHKTSKDDSRNAKNIICNFFKVYIVIQILLVAKNIFLHPQKREILDKGAQGNSRYCSSAPPTVSCEDKA